MWLQVASWEGHMAKKVPPKIESMCKPSDSRVTLCERDGFSMLVALAACLPLREVFINKNKYVSVAVYHRV
jgi:hypothetical protein